MGFRHFILCYVIGCNTNLHSLSWLFVPLLVTACYVTMTTTTTMVLLGSRQMVSARIQNTSHRHRPPARRTHLPCRFETTVELWAPCLTFSIWRSVVKGLTFLDEIDPCGSESWRSSILTGTRTGDPQSRWEPPSRMSKDR
jgi:hypothetical protein